MIDMNGIINMNGIIDMNGTVGRGGKGTLSAAAPPSLCHIIQALSITINSIVDIRSLVPYRYYHLNAHIRVAMRREPVRVLGTRATVKPAVES